MTTVLKINLDELNPILIEDLKKQFGKADVEIHVREAGASADVLTEERFWEIIALFDWSDEEDNEAVMEPAVEVLSKMSIASIYQFQDTLSEKLRQLDTEIHAQVFMNKHPKGHLSVDDFLYVRCCVVANGKEFFERILQHPEEMPQDLTFSAMLHVASKAYERKTGRAFHYVPALDYETYSNEQGWS